MIPKHHYYAHDTVVKGTLGRMANSRPHAESIQRCPVPTRYFHCVARITEQSQFSDKGEYTIFHNLVL
jgi:hypothetical protein